LTKQDGGKLQFVLPKKYDWMATFGNMATFDEKRMN